MESHPFAAYPAHASLPRFESRLGPLFVVSGGTCAPPIRTDRHPADGRSVPACSVRPFDHHTLASNPPFALSFTVNTTSKPLAIGSHVLSLIYNGDTN
jgi:hypothetical protein